MKPFMAKCIQCIALVLMFIISFTGAFIPNMVVVFIGLAVGVAGSVVWLIFGRCPSCKALLGRKLSEYCPHCGKKI